MYFEVTIFSVLLLILLKIKTFPKLEYSIQKEKIRTLDQQCMKRLQEWQMIWKDEYLMLNVKEKKN